MCSDDPPGSEPEGGQRLEFSDRSALLTRLALATIVFGVATLLYFSIRSGPWWFNIVFGVVGIGAVTQTLWTFIREAWRVHLDDREIRAKTYAGLHIRIAWDEIEEIRRQSTMVLGGRLEIVRLISREPKRQIVVSSRLPGFKQLVEAVDIHIPWARRISTPNRWERFLQL